jgi:protein-disulfide isomerase
MSDDSRIEQRKREQEESDEASYVGTVLALLGAAVVLGIVGYVVLAGGGSDPVSVSTEDWPDVGAVNGSDPTLVATGGASDDAVTVVYYGDFQCPHCKDFEVSSFPRLREEYVATGDVEFVFKAVNLESTEGWSRNSRAAALGSRCVWHQNRSAYWRWHSAVFDAQTNYNQDWATASSLGDMAEQVGLDGDAVSSCIEQETYADEYRQNGREFADRGIRSTPGFYIEGDVVGGNRYGQISNAIEERLGAASSRNDSAAGQRTAS